MEKKCIVKLKMDKVIILNELLYILNYIKEKYSELFYKYGKIYGNKNNDYQIEFLIKQKNSVKKMI